VAIAKEWYTVDEAAEYLGISRRTVYKLSHEGRLHTFILGRKRTRRFRKEDLDRVPQPLEVGAEKTEMDTLSTLSAWGDPVLADLWDNEKDAAYDIV
jgi:excisionase family DNA binding protein